MWDCFLRYIYPPRYHEVSLSNESHELITILRLGKEPNYDHLYDLKRATSRKECHKSQITVMSTRHMSA